MHATLLSPPALRLLLTVVGLFIAACENPNHPTTGVPDAVAPLALSCPADVRLEGVATPTEVVSYAPPGHSGGASPVSKNCSPDSGDAFPLGSTTVTCSGTDAAAPPRSASCSFVVTLIPAVPPTPVLSVTKFMAFGDSITAGEINDEIGAICDPGPASAARLLRPQALMPSFAYPAVLQDLLAARYTDQTLTVINEGQRADPAANTGRFAAALRAHRPDAVVQLQGIIDVSDGASPKDVANSLRTDILEAKAQGVKAYLVSTLLPVGSGFRGCGLGFQNAQVRAVNDAIRALAGQEDVLLIDSYAAFVGRVDELMGSDGLHPNEQGQRVIAETFFDAIRRNLEVTEASDVASGGPSPSLLLRPHVQVRSHTAR